jgi:hypothetical protein
MERFIQLELAKARTKRLDITLSVKCFDDLYRFLLSNYGKSHFLYFRRTEDNTPIFETIGKLANIRGTYNWEQWMSIGIISFSRKHMLVTWGKKTHGNDIKMCQLDLIMET